MQKIVVMSYGRLTELIAQMDFSELGPFEIRTVKACIDDVLDKARKIELSDQVDVFVSAGANAKILSSQVRKPFVEIKISGYDILLDLKEARPYSNKIGVVTFQNKLPLLEYISELLTVDITERTYQNIQEIELVLEDLVKEGINTVIGSSLVLEEAKKFGMHGIFIYSTESIYRAIETAAQISLANRQEAAKTEELCTILNFHHEGIIATDSRGLVTNLNLVAERLLGLKKNQILRQPISEFLPDIEIAPVLNGRKTNSAQLQTIKEFQYMTNVTPVIVKEMVNGTVISLKDMGAIQDAEKELYKKGFLVSNTMNDIHTCNERMTEIKKLALSYAKTDHTIVVQGESGTGKELFARGIHKASMRHNKAFVAINCGSFPESLLESELFGYEGGAFTGARSGGKPGIFEMGHGGTILLDEIGEIPLALQTRLLRVLELKELMRIGGDRIRHVDIRVLAATSKNLKRMVEEGSFREDLYYRLNVLELNIPPLRQRPEDVPYLVKHFLVNEDPSMSEQKIAKILRYINLLDYQWPGNVRELKNFVKRFLVLDNSKNDVSDLYSSLILANELDFGGNIEQKILSEIRECKGNKSLAARRLGISRTTLWRRLKHMKSLQTEMKQV